MTTVILMGDEDIGRKKDKSIDLLSWSKSIAWPMSHAGHKHKVKYVRSVKSEIGCLRRWYRGAETNY